MGAAATARIAAPTPQILASVLIVDAGSMPCARMPCPHHRRALPWRCQLSADRAHHGAAHRASREFVLACEQTPARRVQGDCERAPLTGGTCTVTAPTVTVFCARSAAPPSSWRGERRSRGDRDDAPAAVSQGRSSEGDLELRRLRRARQRHAHGAARYARGPDPSLKIAPPPAGSLRTRSWRHAATAWVAVTRHCRSWLTSALATT